MLLGRRSCSGGKDRFWSRSPGTGSFIGILVATHEGIRCRIAKAVGAARPVGAKPCIGVPGSTCGPPFTMTAGEVFCGRCSTLLGCSSSATGAAWNVTTPGVSRCSAGELSAQRTNDADRRTNRRNSTSHFASSRDTMPYPLGVSSPFVQKNTKTD